jgi:hypothetical protein
MSTIVEAEIEKNLKDGGMLLGNGTAPYPPDEPGSNASDSMDVCYTKLESRLHRNGGHYLAINEGRRTIGH